MLVLTAATQTADQIGKVSVGQLTSFALIVLLAAHMVYEFCVHTYSFFTLLGKTRPFSTFLCSFSQSSHSDQLHKLRWSPCGQEKGRVVSHDVSAPFCCLIWLKQIWSEKLTLHQTETLQELHCPCCCQLPSGSKSYGFTFWKLLFLPKSEVIRFTF